MRRALPCLLLMACSPPAVRRPPTVAQVAVGPVALDPPPPCAGARCPPTITCPEPAQAPAGAAVTLRARATGDGVRYRWSVTQAPQARWYRFAPRFDANDSDAIVATGPEVPFTSVIVGSYTVHAEAVDAEGRVAGCDTTVAMTSHGLRVELSWNTARTDVDLHAVTSADPRWFTPADCYYANRQPDTSDPREAARRWLDTDDVDGEGPENIRVDEPASDRDYLVGVNYYSSHGVADPTLAIVVIYCGEQQVARFERDLVGGRGGSMANDFWTVAAVRFDRPGSCTVRPIQRVAPAASARETPGG